MRARPVPSGEFDAEADDFERLGFVGTVKAVHAGAVCSALRLGLVPVLTSLGESAHGQLLNINADVCARELSLALRMGPRKGGSLVDFYFLGGGSHTHQQNLPLSPRRSTFFFSWLSWWIRLRFPMEIVLNRPLAPRCTATTFAP